MILRNLFERVSTGASAQAAARPKAPDTEVGYDPLLIPQLQKDHRRLLVLFATIQSLLTNRDYAGVQRKAGELRVLLDEHLRFASTRLYDYLARHLAAHAEHNALVATVRRETLDSGGEIIDCLHTYSAMRLDDDSAGMLQDEMLWIGTVLMQGMERMEASLFPLYKPAY